MIACGGTEKPTSEPTIVVPSREATAGDEILGLVPDGADSILEIDVGRLRANKAVGTLFRALTKDGGNGAGGLDLFGAGDLVVFVSYGIGDPEPERLVIVRGSNTNEIEGAFRLDDRTVAIASGDMQKRLTLVAAGQQTSLATTSRLLRLRALAMPEGAKGAALRVAAHLDFDARIALAKALDIDEVPVSVSIWGDVADDLAIVALVSGQDPKEGRKLGRALESVRARLARETTIRRLGLGRLVRGATIENGGSAARMVLVVGPRRLARLVERLLGRIGVGT